MAFKYEIKSNSPDSHQMGAFWFGMVYPFLHKDTYNRDYQNPGSISDALANPVAEADSILIEDDCLKWDISSAKSTPMSGLNITLTHSNKNYNALIAPEDWIVFWCFNDYKTYQDTKKLVLSRRRANHFNNAPKFIGRVDSVFTDETTDSTTGRKSIIYNLTAKGFSELDSKIYYNSAIGFNYTSVQKFWADFGNEANQLIIGGQITTENAIASLFRICLGLGPGQLFKGLEGVQTSPNDVYQIPQSIARLLLPEDVTSQKSIGFTYADLMELSVGIQSYRGYGTDKTEKWGGLVPDSQEFLPKVFKYAPLTGEFVPQPLNFNNTSVWSILNTYLNAPINELYTALKVNKDGYVVPTLTCRQLPFSTDKYINDGNPGTKYMSLPRWRLDPRLIIKKNTGRSNATRFNYMQIIGVNPFGSQSVIGQSIDYSNSIPIIDSADVRRAGLSTYIHNTGSFFLPTTVTNKEEIGRQWSKLMADILFGSHLKYTGTVILKGVQEPIAEGDNVEIDGVVYHIERVMHSGEIDPNTGRKDWNTVLALTNGLSAQSENSEELVYPDISKIATDNYMGVNFTR